MDTVERVLTYEEARAAVEHHARILLKKDRQKETLGLLEVGGRVLAQSVVCDRDLPPFNRSTRDGYAVRAADLAKVSAALRCVASVRAGESYTGAVQPEECVEIMTGAPVPAASDAVVMVEYTRRESDWVTFEKGVAAGENIVPTASEATRGETLLVAGTRIDYPEIATFASVGASQVIVYRKPRVAILCTGDEIVPVDEQPGPAQIRNSNAWSLAAQVLRNGGEPKMLPIAPDEQAPLRAAIQEGLTYDLLLLSGGVSMGKHDLVESVLAELGAEFFFTGAKIQPGKPVVFGRARERYFFGLPGNPVSTMVTFEIFVRPVLDGLSGAAPLPLRTGAARLSTPVQTKEGLTRFLPAVISPAETGHGVPSVAVANWKGSGDIVSIARSNAWLIVPPDRAELAAGELVSVLLR